MSESKFFYENLENEVKSGKKIPVRYYEDGDERRKRFHSRKDTIYKNVKEMCAQTHCEAILIMRNRRTDGTLAPGFSFRTPHFKNYGLEEDDVDVPPKDMFVPTQDNTAPTQDSVPPPNVKRKKSRKCTTPPPQDTITPHPAPSSSSQDSVTPHPVPTEDNITPDPAPTQDMLTPPPPKSKKRERKQRK